jgi:hypothetical protein
MKTKSNLKAILFLGSFMALAISINSCKDPENPTPPTNETELITTVKVEFTDTLSGQKLNYFFRDLDGEGGNAPSQWDTIKLSDSSFYRVSIKFLNESNSNAVQDITQEILAEQANHIVCLTPQGVNSIITVTDTDGTYKLGLASTCKTGAASIGNITITLKHQPGIKNGSCDPGETDVQVAFPTIIN